MARGKRGSRGGGAGAAGDGLPERRCLAPGCDAAAMARSAFCARHETTALGAAGARELRQLSREMERLARISDAEAKGHAVRKFRARVAAGDFAILFSGAMQAAQEQAADDAALSVELGAARLAMAQAFAEIDDPVELSVAISRLANAASRTVRANVARRNVTGN